MKSTGMNKKILIKNPDRITEQEEARGFLEKVAFSSDSAIMETVMEMIRNVVFDIGNVLMSFQPKKWFRPLLQEACDQVCDAVFGSAYWQAYDQGVLSLAEVRQKLIEQNPKDAGLIHAVLEQWPRLLQPMAQLQQLRAQCREAGYGVYIISNLSEDSYRYLQKTYRLFEELDGCVLSFREKRNKPDPYLFTELCRRYHLRAEECLFLDDAIANVEAARQCGMQAIHVQTQKQAVKEAEELLCLRLVKK